ncbi:hypothetical protein BTJ44_05255 [Bacillus mycoides]|nr:hypothetical protein BTJ44_05255 [Bacillus mycoides]OSY15307.1 hypothetical protein BTJ48_03727 [Bacillus mycoides]
MVKTSFSLLFILPVSYYKRKERHPLLNVYACFIFFWLKSCL